MQITELKYLFSPPNYLAILEIFSNCVFDLSEHHRGLQARAKICSKVQLILFKTSQTWQNFTKPHVSDFLKKILDRASERCLFLL